MVNTLPQNLHIKMLLLHVIEEFIINFVSTVHIFYQNHKRNNSAIISLPFGIMMKGNLHKNLVNHLAQHNTISIIYTALILKVHSQRSYVWIVDKNVVQRNDREQSHPCFLQLVGNSNCTQISTSFCTHPSVTWFHSLPKFLQQCSTRTECFLCYISILFHLQL